MADIILDLPGIPGESPWANALFSGKIPVQNFSLNAAQEMDQTKSQERTIHTVNIEDMSVSRLYDMSSVPILDALISATTFPTAPLYVLKAAAVTGSGIDWNVKFVLTNVLIGQVNTSFSDSEVTEEITLNFKSVTISYKPQNPNTAALGGVLTTNYDRYAGAKT